MSLQCVANCSECLVACPDERRPGGGRLLAAGADTALVAFGRSWKRLLFPFKSGAARLCCLVRRTAHFVPTFAHAWRRFRTWLAVVACFATRRHCVCCATRRSRFQTPTLVCTGRSIASHASILGHSIGQQECELKREYCQELGPHNLSTANVRLPMLTGDV